MHEQSPQSRPPRPLAVWFAPLAWVIILVLCLVFFHEVATVLLGILAACIIACTLYPLMDYIPGPRGVDVAVLGLGLILIVGGVIFSLSWPLAGPISAAVEDWPSTKHNIDHKLELWSKRVGLEEPPKVDVLLQRFGDFLAGTGGQQLFSRSADVFLGILIALVFTMIGSIFLLSEDPQRLLKPGLRLLAARHQATLQTVLDDLAPRYRRWVIGTLTGMCVVFVASAIGYTSIGLKFAIPLALLAGFAEIIPTVGPATACAIAALFAAATQTGTMALGVLVVYGVIQALEAYIILPMIMRGAVNIHPAVTLFSVVLWGKILGVPGLILAIPINLTLWTLLDHFRIRPRERTEGQCLTP
jgi:predicted PurR-regulated permease PerM